MPHLRPTARLPLLALAALALGACTGGGPFDAGDARDALRAGRGLWQREGAADYAYTVRRTCFCPSERSGPVRVEVRGGRTESVTSPEGRAIEKGAFDQLDTVEELFDAVEEAIGHDPYQLDARYDAARGHPVSLAVDYEQRAIDDESGFVVSDFVVLR